jgi:thiol-disulfide isomerase/thioredoxin
METKKFNYRAIVLVFLAVAGFGTLFALNQRESFLKSFELAILEVGRPAPDFKFPGLDGKMVSLSDYRGKVVLVNIWASWCPPCVDEMPSTEKLYNELKGENFEILAVSIDAASVDIAAIRGGETRSTLSPALFTGKVARVYSIDQQNRELLDSIYCYCNCKKKFGHKSLLSCYVDKHARGCDICRDQTFYAYSQYNNGKKIAQIRLTVDQKFWKPLM